MGVTITDIAKHCGRSVSTVSNVLRDGKNARRYSAATRLEVRQAAETLGYRANFFASQLHHQNRRLVMLAYGSLTDTFAGSIANAFSCTVTSRGYCVLTAPLDLSHELDLLEAAVGPHGILALAVIGDASARTIPDSQLVALAKSGVAVVSIGRAVHGAGVSQVLYDDEAGVEMAITHLLNQGARRFWLLGDRPGEARRGVSERRLDQARVLLEKRGCLAIHEPDLSRTSNRPGSWQPHRADEAVRASLAAGERPDAVFCASDLYAIGAMKGLRESGLVPGRDVAVVGYNDNSVNEFMEPPLTAVHIPVEALGSLAANQLLDCFEKHASAGTVITLDTQLVVRDSCRLRLPPERSGPAATSDQPQRHGGGGRIR